MATTVFLMENPLKHQKNTVCWSKLRYHQVVRGFQAGRREFRTLHAMYRSEAGAKELVAGVLGVFGVVLRCFWGGS